MADQHQAMHKRSVGRPARAERQADLQPTSIRLDKDLRDVVETERRRNGRSLNGEINFRLKAIYQELGLYTASA